MSANTQLIDACKALAADLSGISADDISEDATFMSLGFDSLFLTQLAAAYSRKFGQKVTFRQLIDQTPTITKLAAVLPAPEAAPAPEAPKPAVVAAAPQSKPVPTPAQRPAASRPAASAAAAGEGMAAVFARQLELMQQQLRLLTGDADATLPAAPPAGAVEEPTVPVEANAPVSAASAEVAGPAAEIKSEPIKLPAGFGPSVGESGDVLTPRQQQHIDRLVARYNAKTSGSKKATQSDRQYHADPRTAAGFDRRWKEIVYPLVIGKSQGAYLWDVDGNKYIDMLNGFGPNFFGHNAPFVTEALREQLDSGFELGPQTPRAGEAARLLCELTGMDRASWVNTGSEAVQAAIRLSRTVTSKNKIVLFEGSYHGNFDEVLVRRTGEGIGRTLPLAPGIPFESVGNVIVLKYGEDSALEIIKEQADDIAAVFVEPIQSRRPEFQPREFLHALRRLTKDEEIVLVFDEVITGFRTGPGGAQAHFGIEADLATYGKVLGGGMPIGAVAGRKGVMDTFDGGFWQYGDNSIPSAGVTFFAGTFVRHPLAIAAASASLKFLKAQGPALQTENNRKAARLGDGLNKLFQEREVPFELARFGSQMFLRTGKGGPLATLFFGHMRDRGVHYLEGFPSYMTIAHTDKDVDDVLNAARDALGEMLDDGMLPGKADPSWERKYTPTPAQMDIWIAAQLDADTNLAFNESDTFEFSEVDVDRLKTAVETCLNREEVFRTVFDAEGTFARVRTDLDIVVNDVDHTTMPPEERKAALGALLEGEAETPFDLENGPLVRATLVRTGNDSAVLVLYAHHIAFDGWSAEQLLDRIAEEYRGDASEEPVPFSVYAADVGPKDDTGWWAKHLGEQPPALLGWPGLQGRHLGKTDAHTCSREIAPDVSGAVPQAAALMSVSQSTLWLSAYALLLAEETSSDDVIVGLPVAGQVMHGIDAVGCGVQLLPLRLSIDPDKPFADFAAEVQREVAEATGYPSVSLGELARLTHARTELGRPPLIQAVFNYRAPFTGVDLGGGKVAAMENPRRHLFQELFLNITDDGEKCVYDAEYLRSVFDEDHVSTMLERLTAIVQQATDVPSTTIGSLLERRPVKAPAAEDTARVMPLSATQELMWSHGNLHPELPLYVTPLAWEITGPVDPDQLVAAFAAAVSRHDALSLRLIDSDGSAQQSFGHPFPELGVEDLSTEADSQRALVRRLADICHTPIDLTAGAPLRAALLKIDDDKHWLAMGVHQIACDESSTELLINDIVAAYAGDLDDPVSSFAAALQGSTLPSKADLDWWATYLADQPAPLNLPTDLPRPPLFDHQGGVAPLDVSPETQSAIRRMAADMNVPLADVVSTAFAAFMARMGDGERVIGVMVDTRNEEDAGTVGSFANTALARDRTSKDETLAAALKRASAELDEISTHAAPLADVLRVTSLETEPSRLTGADVIVRYREVQRRPRTLGEASVVRIDLPESTTAAELVLDFRDSEAGVEADLQYAAALFSRDQGQALADAFSAFLAGAIAQADENISSIPMGTEHQSALYETLNDTAYPAPSETALDMIRAQVSQRADKTALVFGDQSLTYDQMLGRARMIARGLTANGVGPDDVVGVAFDRSTDLVCSVLGVWMTGAAYLPLDPEHPAERLAYIRDNARARLVIGAGEGEFTPDSLASTEGQDGTPAVPSDTAYMIYTSGSTGKPKGVVNTHRQLTNFLRSMAERPGFSADDTMLAVTTLSFDISILELFLPLVTGGTVVIADSEVAADGEDLCSLLADLKPTVMQATPATWRMLLDADWEGDEQLKALCGGEALPADLADQLISSVGELWNMYGPTETTVWSSCARITDARDISVGTPIANTVFYVVDRAGMLCPPGIPGELWIGGAGVAEGYQGLPAMTADRFVEDPFSAQSGDRVYRTGDLVRLTPDGRIVHMGRLDAQVKLRGFRIEPGDIEASLAQHDGIAEAVAIVRNDAVGEPSLIAYYTVSGDLAPTGSELRRWMRDRVPPYMVPQHFVELDAMPLSPNGKVDRQSLPAPAGEQAVQRAKVEPSTPYEKALAEVWQEMLGVSDVSATDNFFELGGQSLQAARAAAQFRARTGARIQPRAFIFESLEQIAAGAVDEAAGAA